MPPTRAVPPRSPARRATARTVAPRTPAEARELARARARARARAQAVRAARKAAVRQRRRAALGRWSRRTGSLVGVLALVLVAAVSLAGVRPATPSPAAVALDLAARAIELRDALTTTATDLQAGAAAVAAAATDLAAAEAAAAGGSAVDLRVTTTRVALRTAQDRLATATRDARQQAAGADLEVSGALAALTAGPTSPDQQAADGSARDRWRTQLAGLAAAGITLPSTAQLASGDLPAGLTPARDATGQVIPGVAAGVVAGRVVVVPSAETATATSYALAQLGAPYVPGGTGADGTDCTGLTAAVWTAAGRPLGTTLAQQWAVGTVVPAGQVQVGDLVFSTDPTAGLDDVGVYVGEGQVVTASAVTHQVAILPQEAGSTAVRVTLPPPTPNTPPAADGSAATMCGAARPVTVSAPVVPAWGGFANGQVPASAMCPVGGGHLLRCDAAAAYQGLAQAWQNAFDTPLCTTDSYRSFAAQVDAHERKPRITAVPGTSNHGWGLAIDLCGGVNVAGTEQSAWMARYAGQFGWVHPDWARPGGSNPEPWHWEFGLLA